jgi:hypothetical protein
MEEKYKRKIRGFTLVCIFLLSASIVPFNSGVPQTVNAKPLTPHEHMNKQLATVSLYTFEKERTRQYQVQLSVDDVNELTTLVMKWADAQRINPYADVTERLQHQFLNALRQHWALPDEVIGDLLNAFSMLSGARDHAAIARFASVSLPRYEQRETVFRASITSTGAGILVPMFLSPRPRLITIWRADSGKTLATNYITKFGYNATGPHLGIALGFIGVGFSSRVPNESRYLLVGGALMTVLFGDTITEIVP